MNIHIRRCILIAAALCCACAAPAQSSEEALLAVLKSDAPQQKKTDACIELGRVGTKASVAPLAALLGDETYSHMARYALENIPDPAAAEALRAALGQLKGRLLAGAVQSLGMLRDAASAEPLAKLLGAPDAEVAAAAAVALGRIGSPVSEAALQAALGRVPAAAEGLLLCARSAPPERAAALYDAVLAAPTPPHVKMAARLGAILSRGSAAGLPLLLEQLRSEDPCAFSVALRAGLELPGEAVTRALADELGKLPPAKQACLAPVLGGRGDPAAAPALLALARAGAAECRAVAIGAVARLGGAGAVSALAELACAEDAEVAKAAQAALAGFPGPEAGAAALALVAKPDAKARLIGLELVGRRRMAEAVPDVLRLAGDADAQLSGAAFKVLGDLSGVKDLPALLERLQTTPALDAAERAVSLLCSRQSVPVAGAVTVRKAVYGVLPGGPLKDVTATVAEGLKAGKTTIDVSNKTFGDAAPRQVKKFQIEYTVNGVARSAVAGENAELRLDMGASSIPPAVLEPVLAAYGQAKGAPKQALLRIVCSLGGSRALGLAREAAGAADPGLQEAAQRALCDWPDSEVLPDLEKLIQSGASAKIKVLALRGYVRLAPAQQASAAQKFAALKQAFGWASRDEERKLALASLGTAPTSDALALASSCLGNPALKDEACQAAVAVAENLSAADSDLVAEAMAKVVQASANEDLVKRAKACLKQAKKAQAEKKAAGDETGFKPMCNGKDLTGWETKDCPWWKVVDGVITAESTADKPLASNNHLIWKEAAPGDFELRTEFRLSKSANSGIQLRAEPVVNRDTGYQADMNGGGNFVGFLYHPKMHLVGGRGEKVTIAADGKKESQRFADSAELQKLYKVEDWNSLRVVCRGPAITIYVNGALMSQFEDHRPDTPRKGVITLQLHKGPPMKIEYRDLRIKML